MLRAYRKNAGVGEYSDVTPGDVITDFRGDTEVFARPTRADDPGREGKIAIMSGREFYAGVFGLYVVDDAAPATEYESAAMAAERLDSADMAMVLGYRHREYRRD